MPLFTNEIGAARVAYDAVESRAVNAELRASKLDAVLADLRARPPFAVDEVAGLRQRMADLESENVKLREQLQGLLRDRAQITLQTFIEALGLAAAVGEATMPGRAISSFTARMQAFISMISGGIGLSFQAPELASRSAGLSTISFGLEKIPPQSGVAAAPNLYSVLEEKQRLYTDSFWSRFDMVPETIAEINRVLLDTGAWNFTYLAEAAGAIAALEQRLALATSALISNESASAYVTAASSLGVLADRLKKKLNPVVGDLLAITSSLDATTKAAVSLIS